MSKRIEVAEWSRGYIIARHPIATRAEFIEIVDTIRGKPMAHQAGWQLWFDGVTAEVEEVFGASVCYGVFDPSYFNEVQS